MLAFDLLKFNEHTINASKDKQWFNAILKAVKDGQIVPREGDLTTAADDATAWENGESQTSDDAEENRELLVSPQEQSPQPSQKPSLVPGNVPSPGPKPSPA